MIDSTPVYVDYREPPETSEELRLVLGPDCMPGSNLDYGDVYWATDDASYGWELKSVSDFMHSLWSKKRGERMEKQLLGLRRKVDCPVLGIHGLMTAAPDGVELYSPMRPDYKMRDVYTIKKVAKTAVRMPFVEGFLWSVQHPNDGGSAVTVVWRPTKAMVIAAIIECYYWSRKQEHGTFKRALSMGQQASRVDSIEEVQMANLMSIPGMAEKKARVLLDKWGSPLEVYRRSDEELTSVPGIGKETVRMIRRSVGGV